MFRTIFVVVLVLFGTSPTTSYFTGEYCLSEIFQPSCPTSEAVVITQAGFGRMKFGKCIKKEIGFESLLTNPQYLGCFVDVTKDLNDRCIARKNCMVKVIDLSVEKKAPCSENLVMYLEVEYKCLPIVQENRQCLVSLNTNNVQYLMERNMKSEEKFCGTQKQPWIVEALKGQTIKVTRLRHTLEENISKSIEKSSWSCTESSIEGHVYDSEAKTKITICKERFHYNSNSNQLEIVLAPKYEETILIRLEATGCSDLIPPADAWLKRTENEATIGCYSTRLRWQLKCQGQRWVGVIGNCSYVAENNQEALINDHHFHSASENYDYSQAFTITVVCAIGFILCSIIVCVGVVCIKRFTSESRLAESLLKEKQQTLCKGSIPKVESNGNIPNGRMYHELGEKSPFDDNPDLQGQYFVLDKEEINKCSNHLL